MKKPKYSISILLIICLGLALFTSCEKEDSPEIEDLALIDDQAEDETDATEDETDDSDAVLSLCAGDRTNTPLPLNVGNKWSLKANFGGYAEEISVSKKVVKNDVEYFQVDIKNLFGESQKFLRVDSNGDIYELEELDSGDKEYLLVPNAPTDGQQWDYYGFLTSETYIRKIRLVSVSEDSFLALDMGDCTLTDYIIVDEVRIEDNGFEKIVTNTLFAPGVGFIGGTSNILSELDLN